jgi:glutaminyl-tRNA synthetase
VRLRYAYFVRCREAVKDAAGTVTELRCTYDPATRGGNSPPDGRKVKATLHWVGPDAVKAEVRILESLFRNAEPDTANVVGELNPSSRQVLADCRLEPALASAPPLEAVQFERLGYFARDHSAAGDRLVFNRTVALRDTAGKAMAGGA